MSRSLFWLSDDAWLAIEAHLPKNQPGARRVDDRRVISGIRKRPPSRVLRHRGPALMDLREGVSFWTPEGG
jgi:hypothetical protein